MGDHRVKFNKEAEDRKRFVNYLLNDIQALEQLNQKQLIEDDIVRIGAEQEFCLINENWRPSDLAGHILEDVNDDHFTTELAKYNLEINLDPVELKGDCFQKVGGQLSNLLNKVRDTAEKYNSKIILTGILPTITKHELEFDYMTPNPRYWALNTMLRKLRGSDFEMHLRGVDQLSIRHDSVLFEACNTSFQMHLQIPSYDFISSYNWSQAIAGPVLGICSNSPLLLGRELWSETRIALFQQSIDLRSSSYALKDQLPRVTFGDRWGSGSIVDVFKNDIANFKVILGKNITQNSLETLAQGKIPKLEALNIHNSTIYRWNRPCYGVGGGKPHLRIENRYIPSGPSQMDELANFAFWVGLMKGRPEKYDDLPNTMDFTDAKSNFIKSARTGREAVMNWFGERISTRDLILKELLPMASKGLRKVHVNASDIDQYLGIIEERAKGHTGSQWLIRNYRALKKERKTDDCLLAITKSIYENQQTDLPISKWDNIDLSSNTHQNAHEVHHIMSRQLFTVHQDDPANLATSIMQWMDKHHIPVEDDKGQICGLLTWTHMQKFQSKEASVEDTLVGDIMVKNLHIAHPKMKIVDAIRLMKKHEIGCLPVLSDQHLVGIITISDVLPFDQANPQEEEGN
ncbi:MAG: signal transduction protein [Verrucomicrobia bacterium]|nr:signal transduction protein [Verrucomicrobiota bacterium]